MNSFFACQIILYTFCRLLISPKINFFSNKSFSITIKVSNSLDSDQAQHLVGPDRSPNCLQWLVADDEK